MGDNVTLVRDGALATVTLNRPDRRNSLSDAMLTELGAAFGEVRDDAATRVVIVTGAPPGAIVYTPAASPLIVRVLVVPPAVAETDRLIEPVAVGV